VTQQICDADCGCRCSTCHPYDPALVGNDPRRVYPCGRCLLAMPPGLRKRWKVAFRDRIIRPREHAETVIAVLLWARERTVR
jgi:hypothetical protein